ncbi:MAG: hypothetical protein ABFD29_03880 [Anaerolineaceae bacterium]
MNEKRLISRLARYTAVYMAFNSGLLSRAKAADYLSRCLTPGDETTRFDDSALLNENSDKAIDLIVESEKNEQ